MNKPAPTPAFPAFLTACAALAAAGAIVASAALPIDAAAATPAPRAPSGASSAALARYQRDRAHCLSGQSQEDTQTCLKEAGAALQAARQHDLVDDSPAQLAANAKKRCELLQGDDRKACYARMSGEGTVTGSVAAGGELREYVEVIPGGQAASAGTGAGTVPSGARPLPPAPQGH